MTRSRNRVYGICLEKGSSPEHRFVLATCHQEAIEKAEAVLLRSPDVDAAMDSHNSSSIRKVFLTPISLSTKKSIEILRQSGLLL